MKGFQGANRNQISLLPPDINSWLPERHLARFVVEITDRLDLTSIYKKYQGKGSIPYDPRLLLSLLFYGYSTGVYSSRKIEAATYDSVAFRFIAGNQHPDHDTICTFRQRFLPQIQMFFKEILLIGKELGLLKMGTIYIDGTKMQANASRHKAMSYEHMLKLEKQLEEEITRLMELASAQDQKEAQQELDIPEELGRRKERLERINEAKKVVEARAAERYKKEKEEYDQKMAARKEKQEKTGKKRQGKKPKAPDASPGMTDQYNFSDPESRIMKVSGGFNQCYNAQAAVNADMLIVGCYSNSHANDKQELLPAIASVPVELGTITHAVADTGYFSAENMVKSIEMGIDPFMAIKRESHNSFLEKHLDTNTVMGPGTPTQTMQQKLDSKEGAAIYKMRKQTVEPVFGIIKEVLGFRRFLLRGEQNTDAEWGLVCLGYNIKRLFSLSMS
jgi:transposase